LLFGLRDHRRDLGRLGHVGGGKGRLHAEFFFDARARLLDFAGIAEAVEDDMRALARQCAGDAEADTRGGSGDDRGLSFEHRHDHFSGDSTPG
jgi:hypothetical protein